MMTVRLQPVLAQIEVPGAADGPLHAAILYWALHAVVIILGIAILLVVFRLLRGPTLPDRVVALDMVGTLAAGAIAVYAVRENQPVYLYVAVVLALVLFVGTIAFGFYLEKGIRRQPGDRPQAPTQPAEQAALDPATPPPPTEPGPAAGGST